MNMSGLTVRRAQKPEHMSTPETRTALEAALGAANRGDLLEVRRILGDAKQRIDTFGQLRAIATDDDINEP
jgi:hypothetical protein